jgi:hypothetical protein
LLVTGLWIKRYISLTIERGEVSFVSLRGKEAEQQGGGNFGTVKMRVSRPIAKHNSFGSVPKVSNSNICLVSRLHHPLFCLVSSDLRSWRVERRIVSSRPSRLHPTKVTSTERLGIDDPHRCHWSHVIKAQFPLQSILFIYFCKNFAHHMYTYWRIITI